MRVSRAERTANYVILAAFALFALVPILTILQAALGPGDTAAAGTGTGGTGSFAGLNFGNFVEAWQVGHFGQYMRMSFLVSASVVLVSVGLSILSGFAFGTMRFRGSTTLFYLFLLGIMMPSEAIVVPLYFDLRSLGLTDTFWAIALPQVAQSVAFGTFWMRAYFRSSSRSLIEAARLDGASNRRILWQVLVPLARPALVTLTVLVFMWTWNEFLIPLVMLVSNNNQTVSVAMGLTRGQNMSDPTLQAAASLLGMAPTLIFFLIFQRTLTRGVVVGAVK